MRVYTYTFLYICAGGSCLYLRAARCEGRGAATIQRGGGLILDKGWCVMWLMLFDVDVDVVDVVGGA